MKQQNPISSFIEQYIKLETLAGLLLISVSALAITFANIDGLYIFTEKYNNFISVL